MANNFLEKKFFTCVLLYISSSGLALSIFFFYFGTHHLHHLDVDEQFYYATAEKIVDGTYVINAYRPIGYVSLLALILLITNKNLIAIQIILIFISSLKVPLTYILAYRILNNFKVATLSALVVAIWPPLVFYTISLYSETIAIPLFVAFLAFLPKGSIFSSPQVKKGSFFLSGILLALCALTHPLYICFAPFALLIIFLEEKCFKIALKHAISLVLALFLTLLPWSIVASLHAGSFIFLSSNNLDAIAGGLNPMIIEKGFQQVTAPDGREGWVGPGGWIEDAYLNQNEVLLPRDQKNALLFKRIVEWVKKHPGDALYLQAAKLANMWGIYPLWVTEPLRFFFGTLPILIFLMFSVWALVKFKAYFFHFCRFWVPPLFVSAVAMISWGSWRFRQSADIGLIILTSLLACSWLFPITLFNLSFKEDT